MPDDRVAAGKAPEGVLCLHVEYRRDRMRVSCQDDGRGIDAEAVRRAAIAKGRLPAGTPSPMAMDEAIRLLLGGGVSTTVNPTEFSGRGVGIDAVRAAAGRLRGDLTLASSPEQGTTVTLDMPSTLVGMEVLPAFAAGMTLLIPLSVVDRVVRVAEIDIRSGEGGQELLLEGRVVPYVSLDRLLSRERRAGTNRRRGAGTAILVRGEQGMAAVGVERLLGVTEALVRPLPTLAAADPLIAGASLEASGPPRLHLDAAELAAAVCAAGPLSAQREKAQRRLLVVDDSLTTRMLEQSILESAGYLVDLATSAEDALQQLETTDYDLLLVDVEMPGMGGLAFVERIRQIPLWRHLPAIMVSSRDGQDDRDRALAAGAQDYMVKGEFDQRRLLRRIEDLLPA